MYLYTSTYTYVCMNRTPLQHPVSLHCTLFSLSIALCAHFSLNDHYVSFSFIHFMLFILWSIKRDKNLRSSLLWYYICPIMDFNRTLVWIKCHLQNVSMDWTSRQQRKTYFDSEQKAMLISVWWALTQVPPFTVINAIHSSLSWF